VWADGAAISILGEFRSNEGIGGATIGAATLGLFTFRIGHKMILLVSAGAKAAGGECCKGEVGKVGGSGRQDV